ncbi:TRIM7 ligase, partial [Illadopsis cleaveri]|nr:TRIM7 ligase [Illadopsis cleaveri]
EKVTLDPETAGPFVILSQDYKTIRCGDGNQNLPDASKRFTSNAAVLGSQGFTCGRHYWEVEVENEKVWAVGVALESLLKKELDLKPTCKGVWALQRGQYRTDRVPPDPLTVTEELRRIRVHPDHEMGRVTFYNTENMEQIVQLQTTFTEKVFPYFCLYALETQIRLC